jgi:hypothetical protein
MATNTQAAGKSINARLYLRVKTQIRSWAWGWGKKELIHLSEAETERPWAGLAEWLRMAHSLLDEKTVELTRKAEGSSQVRVIEQES